VNKRIAVDRDGCLIGQPWDFAANHPRFIKMPSDQEINQDVAAFLFAQEEPAIIISNQAGVAWGYKGEAAVIAEMRWLMRRLPIARAYFCPAKFGERAIWVSPTDWGEANQITHPGVDFRKPGPGMPLLAREQGYGPTHYLGDMSGWKGGGYNGRDSDRRMALNYGIRFTDVRQICKAA